MPRKDGGVGGRPGDNYDKARGVEVGRCGNDRCKCLLYTKGMRHQYLSITNTIFLKYIQHTHTHAHELSPETHGIELVPVLGNKIKT